jgi:protein-S-isoprenylcysteine O-methyltransferase Ste14
MNTSIVVLLLLNYAYIGLLPIIFFRRDGKLNYQWWMTALPFFISAALVALHGAGIMQPWYPEAYANPVEIVATVLSTLSIGFISYTLGTHRRPLALWHQRNDIPEHIVTEGAYKRVRHPFYASFIAALIASAALCGNPWTIAISIVGIFVLNHTAAQEERRLLQSGFGMQYREYVERSGRFIPSFR